MSPFFTDEGVIFCSSCGALAALDPDPANWTLTCPNGHDTTELEVAVDAGDGSAQGALPEADTGGEHDHAEVPPEVTP